MTKERIKKKKREKEREKKKPSRKDRMYDRRSLLSAKERGKQIPLNKSKIYDVCRRVTSRVSLHNTAARRGAPECILYTDSSRVPLAFLPSLFCTHPVRESASERASATDFFSCKYLSHARPRALSGQFNIANADRGELIVVEMRDDVDGGDRDRCRTKKTRARTRFLYWMQNWFIGIEKTSTF